MLSTYRPTISFALVSWHHCDLVSFVLKVASIVGSVAIDLILTILTVNDWFILKSVVRLHGSIIVYLFLDAAPTYKRSD
jgi:hypothetical protein